MMGGIQSLFTFGGEADDDPLILDKDYTHVQ
jgi:hypothetical protein